MKSRVLVGLILVVCGAVAYRLHSVAWQSNANSVSEASTSAQSAGAGVSTETDAATLQAASEQASPVSSLPGDLADEQSVLYSESQSEAELYKGMTYSELPEHIRERGLENLRKEGYFTPGDWERSGYMAYDQETIIELARTGDAVAEHMVVVNSSDYSEEVRKEIALSAAMNGRTAGLYAVGSSPFELIRSGRLLKEDVVKPTTAQLIEAYGMIRVSTRMTEYPSPVTSDNVAFARQILSESEIQQAERFADKLYESIERGTAY